MIAGEDCPSSTIHGSRNAYTHHGCRCPEARQKNAVAHARWQLRRMAAGGPLKVDSLGTCRRLRALAAAGWPLQTVVDALGSGSRANVSAWARGHHPKIWRGTAEKIAALYDELEFIPGPSLRARRRAAEKNWAPPEFWLTYDIDAPGLVRLPVPELDQLQVEDLLAGRVTYKDVTRRERREAVLVLRRRGVSLRDIAARLRTDVRAVLRDLDWLREHGLLTDRDPS